MSAIPTTDIQGVLSMLSPIATAGSAGVRALVHAADPVEALLDTPDDHLPGGSVDTSPHSPPGAQLALLAAQVPAGLAVAATAPPSQAVATPAAPTANVQGVAVRPQGGEHILAEAGTRRLMSPAAASPVAALGHPGHLHAGFAQDDLGGLVAAAEAPPDHAAVDVPSPHAAGPERVQAVDNALGSSLADTMAPSPESQYSLAGSGARFGNGRGAVRFGAGDDGASISYADSSDAVGIGGYNSDQAREMGLVVSDAGPALGEGPYAGAGPTIRKANLFGNVPMRDWSDSAEPAPRRATDPVPGSNHDEVVRRVSSGAAEEGTLRIALDEQEAAARAEAERRYGLPGVLRGVNQFGVDTVRTPYNLYTSLRDNGLGGTAGLMLEGLVNTPSTLYDACNSGDMQTLTAAGLGTAFGLKGLPGGSRLGALAESSSVRLGESISVGTKLEGAAYRVGEMPHATEVEGLWVHNLQTPRTLSAAIDFADARGAFGAGYVDYNIIAPRQVSVDFGGGLRLKYVSLPDEVFTMRFGESPHAYYASPLTGEASAARQLGWRDLFGDEPVPVYVRESLFTSDRATTAVLGHEYKEISQLFGRLENAMMPAGSVKEMIDYSLHPEAVRFGDGLVRRMITEGF